MSFPYKRGAETMIADGDYEAVIHKVGIYNNQTGADKLIVEFSLEDGSLFVSFFTPGFEVFDQLLVVAGVKLDKAEGDLDEQKLIGKGVKFTTAITTASNGNEYCNVTSIEAITKKDEEAPFKEEEKKSV